MRITLREDEMARQWYNIQADMPHLPQPPRKPRAGRPAGPEDLAPIFPMNLVEQEGSRERWTDIPGEVLEKLALWRPMPLHRAKALEEALGTSARIYYKNEGTVGHHGPRSPGSCGSR
jgi:tryptophan synthase beta chain